MCQSLGNKPQIGPARFWVPVGKKDGPCPFSNGEEGSRMTKKSGRAARPANQQRCRSGMWIWSVGGSRIGQAGLATMWLEPWTQTLGSGLVQLRPEACRAELSWPLASRSKFPESEAPLERSVQLTLRMRRQIGRRPDGSYKARGLYYRSFSLLSSLQDPLPRMYGVSILSKPLAATILQEYSVPGRHVLWRVFAFFLVLLCALSTGLPQCFSQMHVDDDARHLTRSATI